MSIMRFDIGMIIAINAINYCQNLFQFLLTIFFNIIFHNVVNYKANTYTCDYKMNLRDRMK